MNEELEMLEHCQNVLYRLKERVERDIDMAEMDLFKLKMEIKKKQDVELEAQAKLEEAR